MLSKNRETLENKLIFTFYYYGRVDHSVFVCGWCICVRIHYIYQNNYKIWFIRLM